jgi:hypothetical protein
MGLTWLRGHAQLAGRQERPETHQQCVACASHEQFGAWMRRNDLSPTTAAEALGLSRRMVSDYRTAQRPIPTPVWLARLGYEWLRRKVA